MKHIRTQDNLDEAVLPEITQSNCAFPELNIQLEKDVDESKGRDGSVRSQASKSYREDG